MCMMPLSETKFLNISLLKEVALSVRITFGYPYLLKTSRKAPTIWWVEALGIGTATGYLDKLHLATTICRPPGIGPNRSIDTVCQGLGGGMAETAGALALSGTYS